MCFLRQLQSLIVPKNLQVVKQLIFNFETFRRRGRHRARGNKRQVEKI